LEIWSLHSYALDSALNFLERNSMGDMATASAPIVKRDVWRWGVLAMSLGAWTLTNFDQSMFSYALPGILQTFHLPLIAAGLVLAISFAVSTPLIVVAGIAADRFGRGMTLCILLGASALFVGLQGLAAGIVTLTLARSLGFGLSGGLSPITNALTTENAPARFRGIAMGVLQCGYPLGWLLASLIAAPLLRDYGWRAACFAAFGVIPIAALIGLLFAPRMDAKSLGVGARVDATAVVVRPRLDRLFEPALRRRSLACIATFFLFGGAYAGSVFFFPTFFTVVRGYAPADAASLVGLSNGIAVIGYLAASVAGEYWLRRRTVFALWTVGGALALCGLLWVSTNRTTDFVWFSLMGALFYGAMAVLPVLVAELFDQEIRATALAVCTSAPLALGFAVFPLIVPLVVGRFGWQAGLSGLIAPLLVISAAAALVLPNRASGLPVD
jgi:MFS family permease